MNIIAQIACILIAIFIWSEISRRLMFNSSVETIGEIIVMVVVVLGIQLYRSFDERES